MSRTLISQIKKVMVSVVAVTMMVGNVGSLCMPLQATTNAAVPKGQGTKITVQSFKEQNGKMSLTLVLERSAGIPNGASHVDFKNGKIDFSIDGKQYEFGMLVSETKLEKLSNTKAKLTIPGICLIKGGSNVFMDQFKGKKATFTIGDIEYLKQYTTLDPRFISTVKKAVAEQGVEFAKGNLTVDYDTAIQAAEAKNDKREVERLTIKKECEAESRPSKVLTAKGEKVPVVKGYTGCTLDHAGFVDGKLHLRLNSDQNTWFNLMISAGGAAGMKNDTGCYTLVDQKNHTTYLVYNLKDAAAVSKSDFKIDLTQTLATDTVSQGMSYQF